MKDKIIPNHIGIIMDGNGRWATKRGLSRSKGHLEGSKTLEKIALYANEIGVKVLSVFAFSTDNFKRSDEEVNYLMKLFVKFFTKKEKIFMNNNIKVIFSGRKKPLKEDVLEVMEHLTEKTKNNTGGLLNVCLNYGGQEEIVDSIQKIVKDITSNKIKVEDIDKNNFYKYLYNDIPPIDLLIRTSGEYRISNFMIYEASYCEYYFCDTLFPDFKNKDLDMAIEEYNNRDRRLGGTKNETKSN